MAADDEPPTAIRNHCRVQLDGQRNDKGARQMRAVTTQHAESRYDGHIDKVAYDLELRSGYAPACAE